MFALLATRSIKNTFIYSIEDVDNILIQSRRFMVPLHIFNCRFTWTALMAILFYNLYIPLRIINSQNMNINLSQGLVT